MNQSRKFKAFQWRWHEPLGKPECPYMYRWVFNFFLFSIRIHHWLRSDDKRFFHNHPWAFLSLIIQGSYMDVSYVGRLGELTGDIRAKHGALSSHGKDNLDLVELDLVEKWDIRYRPANHRHYVDVPKGGCWSLLLCGPAIRKWGFWVNNKFYRPLRFFSRHGHPPCSDQ
jgi:hypothetical protein